MSLGYCSAEVASHHRCTLCRPSSAEEKEAVNEDVLREHSHLHRKAQAHHCTKEPRLSLQPDTQGSGDETQKNRDLQTGLTHTELCVAPLVYNEIAVKPLLKRVC